MPEAKQFGELSKNSLQDALLRRLAEISCLRKAERQNKEMLVTAKEELHEIYCCLHELSSDNVIPFRRVADYMAAPNLAVIKRRA